LLQVATHLEINIENELLLDVFLKRHVVLASWRSWQKMTVRSFSTGALL